jgi:cold shock CspA family protein
MKFQGKISSWNEDRGFGFIIRNGGDDKLFVHISEFIEKRRRPTEGDIVTYEVGKDANGRNQARSVAFVVPVKQDVAVQSGNMFRLGRYVSIGLVVAFGVAGYFKYTPQDAFLSHSTQAELSGASESISEQGGNESDAAISTAFANHQSDVQVMGHGIVIKLLSDDNDGSKHQRFILRLASGQTLLVAHNIDLAPRISLIREGDTVEFYGQYEWNEMGGVVHWTHHDPNGSHVDGWLRYHGQKFQ